MTTAGLLLFGVMIGLLSGLLGIGGGIVLVPGLVYLFGFTQPEAQGTSLAVLSVPVLVFAALVYYQHGHVRLPVVAMIVVGFAVGAYIGARLVPVVPAVTLRIAFGALLLYVGLTFMFDIRASKSLAALPAGVAAVIAYIRQRIRGRRHDPSSKEPPTEYHI
jgi:uncharacterized membrane protein YfcA